MISIVITGSTSGIGYGLADSFLTSGCSVTISGRSLIKLERAKDDLISKHDSSRVFSFNCDVTDYEQVQSLWNAAIEQFGKIDIWINNAGIGHREIEVWNYPSEQIKEVIDINVTGAMYSAVAALKGMLKQGFGAIYNMEGLGSNGTIIKGMALYGTTKSALSYLTRAMVKETKGTPVIVGGLRPGMVATKLITGQYEGHPEEWERSKHIFNILSDRVGTVAPWLVRKILANKKTGVNINWLTRFKVFRRFLLAPLVKRNIFD